MFVTNVTAKKTNQPMRFIYTVECDPTLYDNPIPLGSKQMDVQKATRKNRL